MGWFLDLVARHRRLAALSVLAEVAAVVVLVVSAGGGQAISLPTLPTNDLQQLLSLTGYPTPARVPTQSNPEPTLAPVPPAVCGAGSHALAGEQGRVTAADIAE